MFVFYFIVLFCNVNKFAPDYETKLMWDLGGAQEQNK